MRKSLHLVIMVCIALTLVGCLGGGTAMQTYSVSGVVVDSNGKGISGVNLSFGRFGIAQTDSSGKWTKHDLKGRVKVIPEPDGLIFLPKSIEVTGSTNNIKFVGSPDTGSKSQIKVSFVANQQPTMAPLVSMEDLHEFDRDMYKYPFNSDSVGDLVSQYTPHSMIVPLSDMGIAHPNYRMPLALRAGVAGVSGYAPHYDIAFASDILYADAIIEHGRYDFEVVELLFWTKNLGDDTWQEFPIVSEVHVDMGPEYNDVVFPNEDVDKRYGTVHVFQMGNLIPLADEEAFTVRLAFDHHVDKPYIVNPDGEYVSDFNPYFWDAETRIGLAGYVIYLPGLHLDFSEGSKHLIFSWDLYNLVEVYDNGYPDDPSKHIVTLRLDNPFPISFTAEDYIPSIPEGDGLQPSEVTLFGAKYYDLFEKQVHLRWINPAIVDFKEVHIVRKENSEPKSIDDGELIYSGTFPTCYDKAVEEDVTYYYRAFVEDHDGLFSEGETTSITTTLPELLDIQVSQSDTTLSVGERISVHVTGKQDDGNDRSIVAHWSLTSAEVGELSSDYNEFVVFTARKAGTTVLTAEYQGMEASIVIEVVN